MSSLQTLLHKFIYPPFSISTSVTIKENRPVLIRVDNSKFRFVLALLKVKVIRAENVRKVKKGKFNSDHEDHSGVISLEETTFKQ